MLATESQEIFQDIVDELEDALESDKHTVTDALKARCSFSIMTTHSAQMAASPALFARGQLPDTAIHVRSCVFSPVRVLTALAFPCHQGLEFTVGEETTLEELKGKLQEAGGKAAGAGSSASLQSHNTAGAAPQPNPAIRQRSPRSPPSAPPAASAAEVTEGSLRVLLGDLKSGERRERRKAAEEFQSLLKKARPPEDDSALLIDTPRAFDAPRAAVSALAARHDN